jgi:hypothetical protein
MRAMTSLLAVFVGVLVAAPSSSADVSTAGRTIALASSGPNTVPLGTGAFGGVQIDKARRKHVVLIDGTLSFAVAPDVDYVDIYTRVYSTVSGLEVSANGGIYATSCSGSACTVSGHWWLDIDALEAITPGNWVNRPLLVDMHGNTLPLGSTGIGSWALRLQMIKK